MSTKTKAPAAMPPQPSDPPMPPADLDKRSLPIQPISGTFFRIYRNNFKKPKPDHYGKSSASRFDAPAGEYGVIYLARNIDGAFAETFIRNPNPNQIVSEIDDTDLQVRSLAEFVVDQGNPLRLVDLAGVGLARLRLTNSITTSTARRNAVSQAWSKQFYDHPSDPDGIAYMSRQNASELCIAVFERAHRKLKLSVDDRLDSRVGMLRIATSFKAYNLSVATSARPAVPALQAVPKVKVTVKAKKNTGRKKP